MFGSEKFITERALATASGLDLTSVRNELASMATEGLAERQEQEVQFKAKPGMQWAWRLRQ